MTERWWRWGRWRSRRPVARRRCQQPGRVRPPSSRRRAEGARERDDRHLGRHVAEGQGDGTSRAPLRPGGGHADGRAVSFTGPDNTWTVEHEPCRGRALRVQRHGRFGRGCERPSRRATIFEIKSVYASSRHARRGEVPRREEEARVPRSVRCRQRRPQAVPERQEIVLWQKTWNPRGSQHAHYSWIAACGFSPASRVRSRGTLRAAAVPAREGGAERGRVADRAAQRG